MMVIVVDSWDEIIEEDIQNIIFYPVLNQFHRLDLIHNIEHRTEPVSH